MSVPGTVRAKAELLAGIAIQRTAALGYYSDGFSEADRALLRRQLADAFEPVLDPVQPVRPEDLPT